MSSVSAPAHLPIIDWKQRVASNMPPPKLYQQEKIMTAAGKALCLLGVASSFYTIHTALYFTATPLVVIGVVAGSVLLTVALSATGLYLLRIKFDKDPQYIARLAQNFEKKAAQAYNWEEIEKDHRALCNVISLADLNQIYFIPKAQQLSFREFWVKNQQAMRQHYVQDDCRNILRGKLIEQIHSDGCQFEHIKHEFEECLVRFGISDEELSFELYKRCGPNPDYEAFMRLCGPAAFAPLPQAAKDWLKPSFLQYCLNNGIPVRTAMESYDLTIQEILPLVYRNSSYTATEYSANVFAAIKADSSTEKAAAKAEFLARFEPEHPARFTADDLGLEIVRWMDAFDIPRTFLREKFQTFADQLLKEGNYRRMAPHMNVLFSPVELQDPYLNQGYTSNLFSPVSAQERVVLFGSEEEAFKRMHAKVSADADSLNFSQFCLRHDFNLVVKAKILSESQLGKCRREVLDRAVTKYDPTLVKLAKKLGISKEELLLHRWSHRKFAKIFEHEAECQEFGRMYRNGELKDLRIEGKAVEEHVNAALDQCNSIDEFFSKYGALLSVVDKNSPTLHRLLVSHWQGYRFDGNRPEYTQVHSELLHGFTTPRAIIGVFAAFENRFKLLKAEHDGKLAAAAPNVRLKELAAKAQHKKDQIALLRERAVGSFEEKMNNLKQTKRQLKSKEADLVQSIQEREKAIKEIDITRNKIQEQTTASLKELISIEQQERKLATELATLEQQQLALSQQVPGLQKAQIFLRKKELVRDLAHREARLHALGDLAKLQKDLTEASVVTGIGEALSSLYNDNIGQIKRRIEERTRLVNEIAAIKREIETINVEVSEQECSEIFSRESSRLSQLEKVRNQIVDVNKKLQKITKLQKERDEAVRSVPELKRKRELLVIELNQLNHDLSVIQPKIQTCEFSITAANSEMKNEELQSKQAALKIDAELKDEELRLQQISSRVKAGLVETWNKNLVQLHEEYRAELGKISLG